jgi:phosphate transport system permease protein
MTTTAPPAPKAKQRPGDRWFSGTALAAGAMILVTLAAVAIFLIIQSIPGISATSEDASILSTNFWDYVWPLAFGTVWASFLALLMAVPLSIAVALFISHYAPRRLAQSLGYVVDLLAAVPSVVFGLWGIMVLAPAAQPVYAWFTENMGWFPLFAGEVSATGRTIFTAAIVLAVMVVPIITAICREIFLQTPVLHEEAALALGATRWEMIRMAVFPFGRSGIVSAAMLGLGRALGETMAVALVLPALHLDEPQHHPGEHRPHFPRGLRHEHQRADRHGPHPLHRHVRGQRAGPMDRQPPQGILGSQLT